MPKVIIGVENRQKESFKKWLLGEMNVWNVSQATLAYEFGISQPAFGNRIRNCLFSYTDMVKLFKFFNASDEVILRLMRGDS